MLLAALLYIAIALSAVSLIALAVSPMLGLPVLLLSKPIIDTTFFRPLIMGLPLTQIVGAMVPIVVFGHMAFAGGRQRLSTMPLKGIWIVYSGYVLFFSLIMVYVDGIKNGSEVFFRHINGLVGFYLFQALCQNTKELKRLFATLVIAGIFPMGTVIYQVITGVQWHHLDFLRLEGLTRASGLYFHILTVRYYAYQTLIGMLLYTSYFDVRKFTKFALFPIGFAVIFVVFHTYSKAGFLAMFIWALCWTTLQKKYGLLLGIAIVTLGFAALRYEQVGTVLHSIFYKEVGALYGKGDATLVFQGRVFLWAELIDQWMNLNILGKLFTSGRMMTTAHNDYVQMLFHGGIVGLAIYLWLLAAVASRIIRNLRRRVDPLQVAALILFLTYLIDSVGLVPSGYPHFQWLVWGVIGLSFRQREDIEISPSESRAKRDASLNSPAVQTGYIPRKRLGV